MEIRMMISNRWHVFSPKSDITPEEVAKILQLLIVTTRLLVEGETKTNFILSNGLERHFDLIEDAPAPAPPPPPPSLWQERRRKLAARFLLVCLLPVCIWDEWDRSSWVRKFKSGVL